MLLLRRFAAPDPDAIEVRQGDSCLSVAIRRRARARRLTLRVSSATGQIVLTIPGNVPIASARAFADGQAGWIAARLARLPERLPLGLGAEIPLRGVPHRVVPAATFRGLAKVSHDVGGRDVIAVGGGEALAPGRVRRFLLSEAEADLRAAVSRHTATLGIPARRIAIRDTTSRWGSCSATGTLSFSWRLILAPPLVLDYLAAHEVAHLKELNHSARFWRVLKELCPATDEAERWLKRHGAELHRYG